MGIHSNWDGDDKTLIIREMNDRWSWDEYITNCQHERKMIESVGHHVTLIIDARQTLTLPTGALGHFKRSLEDNCGQVEKQIIVSKNAAFGVLYKILRHMIPQSEGCFFITHTLEEAYQLMVPSQGENLPG
jgi:hypothetical protein